MQTIRQTLKIHLLIRWNLSLVRDAIKLSATVLAINRNELPSQMLARLSDNRLPEIQALLSQIQDWQRSPWLRPIYSTLTLPGGALLNILQGHKFLVSTVKLTSDGRNAVSSSIDGTIRVWDIETGIQIHLIDHGWIGGYSEQPTLDITPDDRFVVFVGRQNLIQVCNLATGQIVRTFPFHDYRENVLVTSLEITPDGKKIITSSEGMKPDDNSLKVWDFESGEKIMDLIGHERAVKDVAVTLDGNYVVSASSDQTLKIWDLNKGVEIRSFKGHNDGVYRVILTPDSKSAISGSVNGIIKVWDLATGRENRTFQGHQDWVTALSVSKDGRYVASAGGYLARSSHVIRVWDLSSGKELGQVRGHSDMITGLAITPDNQYVVSSSRDLSLKIWDIKKIVFGGSSRCHDGPVPAVLVTPDNQYAVTVADEASVAMTPNRGFVVRATNHHHIKVWDLPACKERHSYKGQGWIRYVLPTAKPHIVQIITIDPTSENQTARKLNLIDGSKIPIDQHIVDWNKVLFATPDGKYGITETDDSQIVELVDLNSGKKLRTLHIYYDKNLLKRMGIIPRKGIVIFSPTNNEFEVAEMSSQKSLYKFTNPEYAGNVKG